MNTSLSPTVMEAEHQENAAAYEVFVPNSYEYYSIAMTNL